MEVTVVLGFLAVAAVAGLVWPQLADPGTVTRTTGGVSRDEIALAQQFNGDAWYSLLAAGLGLLLGAGASLLSVRRGRDPLVIVILSVLAAFAAAWVMATVGAGTGPPDPATVLATAQPGATAPAQVTVSADAAYLVWPIATSVGCLLVLWSSAGRNPGRSQ